MATHDRFTLRNVYLYLVCFVTLLITIFAAVNLVRGAVELAYPNPYFYAPPPDRGDVSPDEQELQEQREQRARDSQRRQAILGLITPGTLLLIAVPTYAYHWRQIQYGRPRRLRPAEAEEPDQQS
jgi:hypothetical protein